MLKILGLILALSTAVRACKPGTTWVQNYIKKECTDYGAERPIGCVPDNTEKGATKNPGETHTATHFLYECDFANADHTVLYYKPIKCRADDGTLMAANTEHIQKDNKIVQCVQAENGLQKKYKHVEGCVHNQQVVKPNERWVEGDNVGPLGNGTVMYCKQTGSGGQATYRVEIYGCRSGETHYKVNQGLTMYGKYYVCSVTNGEATFKQESNICKDDKGNTYTLYQQWTEPETKQRYYCTRRSGGEPYIYLLGCGDTMGDGSNHVVYRNQVKRIGDKQEFWWCKRGDDGIWVGEKLKEGAGVTHCKDSDGNEHDINTYWVKEFTRYRCYFSGGKSYSYPYGCWFRDTPMKNGQIKSFDSGTAHKCERQSNKYNVRQLTKDEYEAWAQPAGDDPAIAGGGGSASAQTAAPTTTKAPTTTAKAPTTPPPKTTKAPVTATAKPAPSMPTAKPEPQPEPQPEPAPEENKEPEPESAKSGSAKSGSAKSGSAKSGSAKSKSSKSAKSESAKSASTKSESTKSASSESEKSKSTKSKSSESSKDKSDSGSGSAEQSPARPIGPPGPCADRLPICGELAAVCVNEAEGSSEKESRHRRYKRHAGELDCAERRRRCHASHGSDSDSTECDLHQYHCCPCSWNGCRHCYDSAPRMPCKNCDKLKKRTVEMVQRFCPVTCDKCREPHQEADAEEAAETFAMYFLKH